MSTPTHIDTDRRILLVGGGTGGHFYPLIAIAEYLNTLPSRPELYYAGPDEYDTGALQREGITFIRIGSGKQRRYASFLNFLDVFKTFFGTWSALIKIFILYPDVIVSKGGYTSVPVILASAFFRIPIIVHESDSVLGRANRLALRFARHIITAYDGMVLPPSSAVQHTLGIPVRSELSAPVSSDAISSFSIDPNRPVILIIGGSQGAQRINEFVLDSLDELLSDFTIIHQTGTLHFDSCAQSAKVLITNPELQQHYHPVPFLEGTSLNDAYHLAWIVISRAGSGSIQEIALHGKPSILIPIPEEISHDQHSNAYAYARSGATIVIEEKNLSDDLLRIEIGRMMQNPDVYRTMQEAAYAFGKKDATAQIVDLVTRVSIEH